MWKTVLTMAIVLSSAAAARAEIRRADIKIFGMD